MRNPSITQKVVFHKIVTPFWPHENVTIMSTMIMHIFPLANPKSRSFSFSRLVHDQQELICTIDFCLVKEDGSR